MNYSKALKLINLSQVIFFTTHEKTDSDDFGSISALAQYALSQKKQIRLVINDIFPENLKFIPLSHSVMDKKPDIAPDLIVYSGCSNPKRANLPFLSEYDCFILNIDHHLDSTPFGDINLIDSQKSSVAEIIFDFFNHNNLEITKNIATSILSGIIGDTGCFIHSSTNPQTLKSASKLVSIGADIKTISKNLYQSKTIDELNLIGKVLQNSQLTQNKVAYASLKVDESKVSSEGVIDILNNTKDSIFSVFVKQEKNKIKGSLRSESYKNINVQKIAKALGGGGHRYASGFSFEGKLEDIFPS